MGGSRHARVSLAVVGLCAALSCTDVRVVAVELAVVALEPDAASILLGDSLRFEARLLDRAGNALGGYPVAWSSSDPAVAPVDETGEVKGLAAGHASITATSEGRSATAEVSIEWPAPVLTAVAPSSAQRLQTVDLVLTGAEFQPGATMVDLGPGVRVDSVAVTAPESMAVRATITGEAALGTRPISVTTPAPGGGTATLPEGFTIAPEHPAPALTAADPSDGQRGSTLEVTLTGSGFLPGLTEVRFGPGITVSSLDVTSESAMLATVAIAASAALGPRDVTVTNPGPGGGAATLAAGFTVLPANPVPSVEAVTPGQGQRQTTLDVTLSGSGFLAEGTTVGFGPGVQVDDVAVETPTTLTARLTIGAGAQLGPRNVTVTNPAPGGGSAVLADGFTVLPENPAPELTGVDPAEGQRRDRLDVTLSGSGFVPGVTSVDFGQGVVVHGVQVHDAGTLDADVSIEAGTMLGARAVTVTNAAPGGGTATLPDGFTVLEENPAPTLTAVLPGIGVRGVTRTVTLVGTGFVSGLTSVSFGEGITVDAVNVVFWTSLTATITISPDAALGLRDVAVTNAPPGGGTFVMHDGFTVVAVGF